MSYTKTKPLLRFLPLCILTILCTTAACSFSGKQRVVVMPFENLSALPDDQWVRDAFSESLSDHLNYADPELVVSREELNDVCRELQVAPYLAFSDHDIAAKIGLKLKATRMVLGTFRRRDETMVAFTHVLDVRSKRVLHSYRQANEAMKNYLFFKQVNEIATGMLPAMGIASHRLKAAAEPMRDAGVRTSKLKAYEYYIQGRLAAFRNQEEEYRVATTWYDEAIKLDFRFALAYIGKAETFAYWGFLVKQSNRPYQEYYRKAYEASNRAKLYDARIPAFHRRRYERILQADIDFVVGETHLRNKQYNEAIAAFRKSLALTPNDSYTLYRIGEAYFGLGEIERAKHHYVSALERNPTLTPAIDRLESLMQE